MLWRSVAFLQLVRPNRFNAQCSRDVGCAATVGTACARKAHAAGGLEHWASVPVAAAAGFSRKPQKWAEAWMGVPSSHSGRAWSKYIPHHVGPWGWSNMRGRLRGWMEAWGGGVGMQARLPSQIGRIQGASASNVNGACTNAGTGNSPGASTLQHRRAPPSTHNACGAVQGTGEPPS